MKICIITLESAREPKTWSRTPLSIIECLEKRNIEIDNLSYLGKKHHYGLGKIKVIFDKIFYNYGGSFRDPFPFWYQINARFFEKEMAKYSSDAFIFMGEHCVKNKKNLHGKTYVYMDRVVGGIAQFDENKRMCKKQYLGGYEKNDKRSLSCMNHIFTQNDWSRNEIIKRYNISKDKVTNIGFGLNINAFRGLKHYDNHKMLIVLREGTEHYKGLDLLLDAFAIAKKKIIDLTLHVVGTDYKKMDGVYYYFNQPRTVTEELFQTSSLYTMPALLEPNGITYLEALANKTPILGLNRFAFPEFCGYGKYGFVVENDNPKDVSEAIIKAFSNISELERMGNEGQKYVLNHFSWESTTKKMISVIMDDLGQGCHQITDFSIASVFSTHTVEIH